MAATGLVLKESFCDAAVLDTITVTRTEVWNVRTPADYQPATWTACWIEGDDDQADAIAERLSQAMQPRWYGNLSTAEIAYVIFAGRVFKYGKGDRQGRAVAQEYGRSVGIPERQLDWRD